MKGKMKKSSKGHTSGFFSGDRHSVDNMGESEELGSSGWLDPEDLFATKRRRVSLDVEKSVIFNVPSQLISPSKLSPLERRGLETRLREELEQIKMFQNKIFRRDVVVGSAPSTCSKGIRHASSIQTSQSKHGNAEVKPSLPMKGSSNKNAILMKRCGTLLELLRNHQFGWVFNRPVDVVKLNLPDYFSIIEHPMDLGTIKSKLTSSAYLDPWEFMSDVRLTFTNAMTYNPPGNNVHIMARSLSKYFEVRWKHIEKKLSPSYSGTTTEKEAPVSMLPKKINSLLLNRAVASNTLVFEKPKMSAEEKHRLGKRLESSIDALPEHVIDFLRRNSCNANQAGEDEIELDIDSLSDDILYELERLLEEHSVKAQQVKDNACEMEALNESGLSNSFVQPSQVKAPDEDVDIGGNDPPVSSYVELERDTAIRNSNYGSSGDISRESASSTNDSAASLGSESGAAKVSTLKSYLKEPKNSLGIHSLDHEKNAIKKFFDVNRSHGISDQQEQNSHCNAVTADENSHEEGMSTRSERHASPEKLYRAALLRRRFADTILKAREKTREKSENGDPDKLRREREELERQQREEKARLLAEAKAAEDAHRRAEAAASAEARQKRELEREAARQALLEMEKTADVNENCQFLKDLEMLGTARTETFPTCMDETSPHHSYEGVGDFKLGGGNPLEQLGLFMKADDEEDEEVVPKKDPASDAEGESDQ